MSDPTGGSSAAGLLEGLTAGAATGFNIRERARDRRNREKLQEDLLTLRQLEARQRIMSAEVTQRHATRIENEADRAERLRDEVANYLRAPEHFKTLGQYISGQEGEREAPPLSPDAVSAREVGRTLGSLTGRHVTDDQALVLGSGQVPTSVVRNLRPPYQGRPAANRVPTYEAATKSLDRMYDQFDEAGAVTHLLTPAQRHRLATKIVNGSATDADFPPLPGKPAAPGQAPAKKSNHGYLRRIWDAITDSGDGGGTQSSSAGEGGQSAVGGVDEDRVQQGRELRGEFKDLSDDDFTNVLRDEGYTDEEIDAILTPDQSD